jgi:cytochrome c biogenesis protein CcmG/thiol:disulfide interchange protein DsbE
MTNTNANPKRGVPAWAQFLIWTALAILLVLVYLGLRRSQEGHVQKGKEVGNFTLSLFQGYEYQGQSEVSLDSLRGKVVVLNFWASWCLTCKDEAYALESAWQFYKPGGDVVFLGVDYVDTEPEARAYLEEFGITYPNGPDLGTRISQAFRIQGVPETYFIDKNGVVAYVQIGSFSSESQIHAIIDKLLGQ